MRFACVCEFARMMSHARSMQRKRCLCRQLGMAGTVSMGTRRARPQHGHPRHGLRVQVRPCRAASAPRSGRRQLHRRRAARGAPVLRQPHSRSTKASRDAGPVFLNTIPHGKAALATLRPPSAAQTAPFHSKPRLEAALHPPFWYLNSDTFKVPRS
jgi:hypothetical protein